MDGRETVAPGGGREEADRRAEEVDAVPGTVGAGGCAGRHVPDGVERSDRAPTCDLRRAGGAADPLERGDIEDTGDPSATPEEGAGQEDGGTPANETSSPNAEHTR